MRFPLQRRELVGSAMGLGAAALLAGNARPGAAQVPAPAGAAAADGPFRLDPLPYAASANEPSIDAETMELHHDRHHAAYVTGLNALVRDQPQLAAMPVQDILARLDSVPEAIRTAVRNNAGGHANHAMFWTIMGGRGGAPDGELAAAISRDLGGFEAMKAEFNRRGAARFGSGWVFVTVDRAGRLALTDLPNQDSPLMTGAMPLMGNDVWEHAYYLTYRNRRPDYLQAWWNVLNWQAITGRYAAARVGTLTL
ncbi:superoxide dismutase [Roseomonas elaeocarpi]|uniref:Superoxide dismutase n=1 Tax=Roseomonas elaeocarpi TaxID=907779 RepID=A0ABV6JSN3_9PROT